MRPLVKGKRAAAVIEILQIGCALTFGLAVLVGLRGEPPRTRLLAVPLLLASAATGWYSVKYAIAHHQAIRRGRQQARVRVTRERLATMRAIGIPEDVLQVLQDLTENSELTGRDLEKLLRERIGEPRTVEYLDTIIEHARYEPSTNDDRQEPSTPSAPPPVT